MAQSNPNEKPVHIPRPSYPEPVYPAIPSLSSRTSYGETDEDSIHLLDYWHVLLARRWTVLAVFVTIVTVTAIATFKQTPIYRASATIQIDRENSNVLSFKEVYGIESATDDMLRTQYKVLESRSLARGVIDELDLEKEEEFKPTEGSSIKSYFTPVLDLLRPRPVSTTGEQDSMRPLIDTYLDGRLKVEPVRQARLVTVSFESKDPKLATRVINAHANRYIEQNFQFKLDATHQAERFLQEEVNKLKAKVENAEDRLQAYSREKQIFITEQGQNTATDQLTRLQEEYNRKQEVLVQKKSYHDLIEEGRGDTLPQLVNNQLVSELNSKLADLEKEDSRLKIKYGPNWEERKQIVSQIDNLKQRIRDEKDKIIDTAESEYATAVRQERTYFAALEDQRTLVETLNQDFIHYNILKREADSVKQLYDSLLQRQKEASVSASLRATNIRVVDPAEVPVSPVKPRKTLNLALGALFGMVFGVGLAFFREYLDNSLKSPDDVNRYLKLATLGTIPNLQSLTEKHSYGYGYGLKKGTKETKELEKTVEKTPLELISHGSPSSLMAEAYRSMRTSLLLSSADHAPQVVLVTSAVPSEGKTVTAINTAISLTQTGKRVVLIDGDMRKPRVHSVFAFGNVLGLSSFLTGSAGLKDVLQESPVPNLFVLPCGIIPPNPGELILSSRFTQLLQVLRQYFDYVVIDSPPVASVSDARVLASSADAVVLVVKAFSTSRDLAKRAVDLLTHSRVRNLSVILNDLDVHARTGYYSNYSGRYYYPSNYGDTPSTPAPPQV
jgi:succinoglycan biosynthesis transport protein ExoP